MTLSDSFPAVSRSHRGISGENLHLLFVGTAALPLGLLLDRWFGLLPALTARCGGSETLWGTLVWHRACMPATCLMTMFAAPASIGLKAMTRVGRPGHARHDCRMDALAALRCHVAMLAAMACCLGAGRDLAAFVGLPWTSGVAIAVMALGMVGGMAAAFLCEVLNFGAPRRSRPSRREP